MKTKENLEKEAVASTVPQPAHLADLIWHYYQSEQTDAFDKILSFLLEAEKAEFAIELLKLRKLDQIYGAIDQIAVKGIRALGKKSRGTVTTSRAIRPKNNRSAHPFVHTPGLLCARALPGFANERRDS